MLQRPRNSSIAGKEFLRHGQTANRCDMAPKRWTIFLRWHLLWPWLRRRPAAFVRPTVPMPRTRPPFLQHNGTNAANIIHTNREVEWRRKKRNKRHSAHDYSGRKTHIIKHILYLFSLIFVILTLINTANVRYNVLRNARMRRAHKIIVRETFFFLSSGTSGHLGTLPYIYHIAL